jgi:hypothetical protein
VPLHNWTRVDAGIFHAFHHGWITEIGRALNRSLLPADYYALPEKVRKETVAEKPEMRFHIRPEPVFDAGEGRCREACERPSRRCHD